MEQENTTETSTDQQPIRSAYGSADEQFGDLYLPVGAGPHPVVVFIHGGFWQAQYDLHYAEPLCLALTARGVAVWNLEYRRVGQPGGGWMRTFEDVALGLAHLDTLLAPHTLDRQRIAVMGHSAGGQLAFWLAARQRLPASSPFVFTADIPLIAAISLAGVLDLRQGWELQLGDGAISDLLGGSPTAYPERYALASPAQLLPIGVPQILIHGTADKPVPYVMSERYHERARAQGDDVRLIVLPDSDHFALTSPQTWEGRLVLDTACALFDL